MAPGLVGQHQHGVVEQVAHRENGFAQLHLAGVDLGKIQHVIDQVEQMGARLEHVFGIFGIFGVAERAIEFGLDDLGKAQDGVQGRAQFVAHAGQEFRLGMIGLLGFLRHVAGALFAGAQRDIDLGLALQRLFHAVAQLDALGDRGRHRQHHRDQHGHEELDEIELIAEREIGDGGGAIAERGAAGQNQLGQDQAECGAFQARHQGHDQKRHGGDEQQRHADGKEVGQQDRQHQKHAGREPLPVARQHAALGGGEQHHHRGEDDIGQGGGDEPGLPVDPHMLAAEPVNQQGEDRGRDQIE